MTVDKLILFHLVKSEDFARQVLPYIKADYFTDQANRWLYSEIHKFYSTYNKSPSWTALKVALDGSKLFEDSHKATKEAIDELERDNSPVQDVKWMVDTAEDWSKNQALFNALLKSIQIKEGKIEGATVHAIPGILSEALAVGFNHHVSHDWIEDASERWEYFHENLRRIPFHITMLNTITGGGIVPKTLTVPTAGVNVGKSLFCCDWAAFLLQSGFNVGYITLEMSEENIANRIDFNLLDKTEEEILAMSKDDFVRDVKAIKDRTAGRLVIQEYPPTSVHVGHFRYLLDHEWKIKKNFVPDILFVDYINLMMPQRFKIGEGLNTYGYVKASAEELRGLAVEKEIPIITPTQFNRSGYSNENPTMADTAESWGLPQTVDLQFAMWTDDQLAAQNMIMLMQLKNRLKDVTLHKKFLVGINRAKMRLYDVDNPEESIAPASSPTAPIQNPYTPEPLPRFEGIKV